MDTQTLAEIGTGRYTSLFEEDVDRSREMIASRLDGRRVLVIGGAGSIGAATVHELTRFRLGSLHVVDQNENGLAELVRDLRSRPEGLEISDFQTWPVDFGSPIMHQLIRDQPAYDAVLNFAAIKHVRSEKDTCSLLQMLDTNVVKPARLLRWLESKGHNLRYFCVSTDKAANPVNLMGASKRAMEHIIFSGEVASDFRGDITSARFANVAFSDGSLLFSWLRRMEKRQPLAVPRDTRRFFVSLRESGQLCLLAAICAPDRHLLIPRLDAQHDLRSLEDVVISLLHRRGYEPHFYDTEAEAKARFEGDAAQGRYPVLRTALDTSGEKPYEEFIGNGESSAEIGMANLLAVNYRALPPRGRSNVSRRRRKSVVCYLPNGD